MGATIRARFLNGVIEPLEKLNITEGKEFLITIINIPFKKGKGRFERSAGSWKGSIDADKLIKDIYSDRLVSTRKIPKFNVVKGDDKLSPPFKK